MGPRSFAVVLIIEIKEQAFLLFLAGMLSFSMEAQKFVIWAAWFKIVEFRFAFPMFLDHVLVYYEDRHNRMRYIEAAEKVV